MMNVALKKPIEVSSSSDTDTARHKRFLVDGFIPYLMDAAHGDRSPAPLFETDPEKTAPAVMIDLGASFPVNQINIHSIDLSHTIPEAVTDGYAIPRRFRVMGANDPSLKDATLLFEYTRTSIYDAGPVLMWNIPGTRCRYVQIVALEIDPNPLDPEKVKKIGFAEIEVFANSRNVALNQPVYANDGLKGPRRRLNQITDGNNFYGKILPLQDWMNQLARRHDLETERPRVAEELTRRYVRQKVNLTRAIWLIVLLLGGGIILILAEKLLRQRAITRTRERIAANLHDELGANLHAIGILGTYAKKVLNSPEKLIRTVDEIKSLTDRTGEATRYCAHIQTAIEDHENLADDLRRAARGMIANLEYDFVMKGEDILKDMKPRNRADLYLFFKESLVNINRHANATKVNIQLTCDLRTIHLDISDNGCGILENEKRGVPASLKRRARLLKANVSMEQSETGGTRITLQIQLHRPFCYIQRVKRKKSES
jgi:signal transduction histidine kinase